MCNLCCSCINRPHHPSRAGSKRCRDVPQNVCSSSTIILCTHRAIARAQRETLSLTCARQCSTLPVGDWRCNASSLLGEEGEESEGQPRSTRDGSSKEESMSKARLYAIGASTTLASHKSLHAYAQT